MRLGPLYGMVCLVAVCTGFWFAGHFDAADQVDQTDAGHQPKAIHGRVFDKDGPVAHARVRFKGDNSFQLTDRQGRFKLLATSGRAATATAWKEGYFIAGRSVPTAGPLEIQLSPLPREDYAAYQWVDPRPDPESNDNCGNCHEAIYREWQTSGHSGSARNRHFLNLYDGTDWHGRADRGWNLKSEYPEAASVCAACHAPAVEPGHPAIDDLRQASGTDAEGVHCDFCHKVHSVVDDDFGLAHGRYGVKLLRPAEGQVLLGPLDDVDRGVETYSPLQKESRYCGACHEGVVLGVHVYSTFTEWRNSPAGQAGRTCQSCHMAPTGSMTNLAPGAGGFERDPNTLASHTFLPGGRAAMLRRCLHVDVSYRAADDHLLATVEVVADNVGHRVPTGFIDRNIILVVQAVDGAGNVLAPQHGPILPAVVGSPWQGQPGLLFAKQLVEADGQSPVPFWRAGSELIDTRLLPGSPRSSTYRFPLPTEHIRVRLLYRRFWPQVARDKSWPDNEIVVLDRTVAIRDASER